MRIPPSGPLFVIIMSGIVYNYNAMGVWMDCCDYDIGRYTITDEHGGSVGFMALVSGRVVHSVESLAFLLHACPILFRVCVFPLVWGVSFFRILV
jgi:hypothetical protein